MSMRRLLLTLMLTLPAFSAYAQTPIYCLNNGVLAPCSASNPLQVSGSGGGGSSGTPIGTSAWLPTQVAMTTSAALIVAARTGVAGTGRAAVTINNPTSAICYIGPTSGVTASTGFILSAGSGVTLNTQAAVYGLCASSGTISEVETY